MPPTDSPGSPAPKVDLGTALDEATDKMDEECPHFTWTRRECDRCQRAILLTFADRVRGEEIERLRQGLWDVYRILGFDTDGQETPHALAHPDIVELLVRSAEEFRRDYDEAISERGEREKRLREAVSALRDVQRAYMANRTGPLALRESLGQAVAEAAATVDRALAEGGEGGDGE